MADDDSEDDYVASESDRLSSPSSPSHHEPLSAPLAKGRTTQQQAKSDQKPAKGYLSKDYRDLLNIDIEDVNAHVRGSGLDTSYIGASKWTSHEKDALFQCLASRGPGDLRALVRAVRTKSEQEVHVYLQLLQAGVTAQNSKDSSVQKRNAFMYDEVPAAAEISLEGEHALNLAADALAAHVEKHIHQQQHEKHGDEWLVDADVAERMDTLQEQSQMTTDVKSKASAEAPEGDLTEASSHAGLLADFDTILRPSAFLQLSRDIFMNNGEDDSLNWHHVDCKSPDPTEPALFRSALEDFRDIVVSITRRVVQATIFQATSRLRAEDASRKDWTPLAAIREVDARTAIDLLNLPRDDRIYWANTVRRCRVGVFSDSKKYDDGRPSTKSGHRLSYEEVETELGLHDTEGSISFPKHESQSSDEPDEDDIDDLMNDSDLFTEEEIDTSTTASPPEVGQGSQKAPRKRKRAMSPSARLRAETKHLEAVDTAASMCEEKRLWNVLRRNPPDHITMDHQIPAFLSYGNDPVDGQVDWRTALEYESGWEQESGTPLVKRFKDMDALGKAGKTKRELISKMVERQLEIAAGADSSEGHATDDERDNFGDEDFVTEAKSAAGVEGSDSEGSK